MAQKPKRKRKPMTAEQKAAAAERLAKARAAKAPSQNLSVHESIRDLPDDHPLSPKKVKEWLREHRKRLASIKSYRLSKERKERDEYREVDNYIKTLTRYLDSGVWTEPFWGENRENRMYYVCVAPAYDKNGEIKRSKGVFYRDLGYIYGEEPSGYRTENDG